LSAARALSFCPGVMSTIADASETQRWRGSGQVSENNIYEAFAICLVRFHSLHNSSTACPQLQTYTLLVSEAAATQTNISLLVPSRSKSPHRPNLPGRSLSGAAVRLSDRAQTLSTEWLRCIGQNEFTDVFSR
jgi:hypothetical protein